MIINVSESEISLAQIMAQQRYVRLKKPLSGYSETARGMIAISGIMIAFVSIMLFNIAGKERWAQVCGKIGIGVAILIAGISIAMWQKTSKAQKIDDENKAAITALFKKLKNTQFIINGQNYGFLAVVNFRPVANGVNSIGKFYPLPSTSTPSAGRNQREAVSRIVDDTLRCINRRNILQANLFLMQGSEDDIALLPITESESAHLLKLVTED